MYRLGKEVYTQIDCSHDNPLFLDIFISLSPLVSFAASRFLTLERKKDEGDVM